MNAETQTKWDYCFEQFNALSNMTRSILRRCAANHLVDRGFEEVGSSDINHELFGMWETYDQDWARVMTSELDLFANQELHRYR